MSPYRPCRVIQVRLGVVAVRRSMMSASMIPHQAAIGTPSVIRNPSNWFEEVVRDEHDVDRAERS